MDSVIILTGISFICASSHNRMYSVRSITTIEQSSSAALPQRLIILAERIRRGRPPCPPLFGAPEPLWYSKQGTDQGCPYEYNHVTRTGQARWPAPTDTVMAKIKRPCALSMTV